MKVTRFSPFVKLIVFYLLFMLLHYLYDFFPNDLTVIIGGINESVFQHMKIALIAYSFTSLIEFLVTKDKIQLKDRFLYSRLFTSTFLPLIIMVVYLVSPLVFGKIENVFGEIIWANFALLSSTVIALIIESHIEKTEFSQIFKFVIFLLFLISLTQYIVFTYQLPWFDILAIPPGW